MNSRDQFGRTAAAYATSPRHVLGAEGVVEFGRIPTGARLALDIATGAGHTAHALAARCEYVLSTDITPEMISQSRRLADEKGIANLGLAFSLAESLPYADASFDVVACRVAPHHFDDVPAFLREARRVLKPDGRLIIDDTVSPEDESVHEWQNEVERLRDPSHVDDYRVSTWQQMVEAAGMRVEDVHVGLKPTDHELYEWTERASTAPESIARIRELFESAGDACIELLSIHRDGATWVWGWPSMTLLARPA